MPALTEEHLHDLYRTECLEIGLDATAMYDRLIEEGSPPGFAAMLATKTPPGTKGTDRAFLEGSHEWAGSMSANSRKYIMGSAKKAGISTSGKVYKSGIGKPSDPMAWVSDVSDVLKACKSKGMTVSGAVNYEAPAQQPKRRRMSEKALSRFTQRYLANPETAAKVKGKPKKMRELQEKIVDTHSKPQKD